ncbi:hypothetical protein [Nocardia alni]|uniref:hypothetical protein n=1 Tax=Nocardia alni TaxID=2815723 RepID=UPI001C235A7B|nr:hypothetical protein [Nocardia alni]
MTGLPWYFTDPEDGAGWFAARCEAIDHILTAIAQSPWSPRLVLFGGDALMRAWFCEWASQSGGLEFAVRFELWQAPEEPTLGHIFDDILADAAAISRKPDSTVVIDRLRCDYTDIGESYYDRGASGDRLLFSWQGRGHTGTINLDFCYDTTLYDPPVPTPIPRVSFPGTPLVLPAASQRQSLAWKIARLAADADRIPEPIEDEPEYNEPVEDYSRSNPLGRDLYEAVLLAERSQLPLHLLDSALGSQNILLTALDTELSLLIRIANDVDWNTFADDLPALAGAHEQFVWRFAAALAPTFPSGPSQLLSLLTEHCVHELPALRTVLDSKGVVAAARWFADYTAPAGRHASPTW